MRRVRSDGHRPDGRLAGTISDRHVFVPDVKLGFGTDGRGRAVPAGVYFVCLSAGGEVSTGRLTLVR
jgi:hypothetical protein